MAAEALKLKYTLPDLHTWRQGGQRQAAVRNGQRFACGNFSENGSIGDSAMGNGQGTSRAFIWAAIADNYQQFRFGIAEECQGVFLNRQDLESTVQQGG